VRVDRCNNIWDFRSMARRRLPGPIFHYIDGAADDEVTYRRNTEAYERCDLVPSVLAGVESIDMSITVMGARQMSASVIASPWQLACVGNISNTFMKSAGATCQRRRVASTCIGAHYSGF
jgi:L-lactate dehydrogenase (cytochrome)